VKKPAPSIAMRIVSWTVLLLIVAVAVGGFGIYIHSIIEMPWWQASLGGLVLLVGIVGYVLGREAVYRHFCNPLGYACELRPVKPPRSARDAVELVISGKFGDRPFALYREQWKSSSLFHGGGSSSANTTVLEWAGDDIQLGEWTLPVTPAAASGTAEPFANSPVAAGLTNLEKSLRPAAENPRVGAGTKLTDPVAGAALTPSVRDALERFIGSGNVEAKPGLLVFRQDEVTGRRAFPMPWSIEEFLKQGDEIRRIVMA